MYIAFLWHMHQPFYKDILKNTYYMPWTFLHAIKDYYDMISILDNFDNVKLNFNYVPSLLEQLIDYTENPYNDYFLTLISKDVSELNDDEKKAILRQVFCVNYDTMVVPIRRFRKLFKKKEFSQTYSNQEMLDLEVLYLISWTGYYIKSESDLIKELLDKGESFTEKDKETLLNELFKFVKAIIPKYKQHLNKKTIEISTSPYYHPILPLLVDVKSAQKALPNIELPKMDNNFKDDAEKQVKKALDSFHKIFDTNCQGMWPSEGSVSNETLKIIGKYNLKWVATDEDILFLSKNIEKRELYYPYKFNNLNIFFRDKELSNIIGFIYSKWHYKDAANDFYQRIKNIQKFVNSDDAIVSIILDGENAWEFYENNGVPFLTEIYKMIEEDNSLVFTTFSEYLENVKGDKELENIHSGSWINANFKIWIGHPETNKAWELLDNAKTAFNNANSNNINEENIKAAEKELLIAEGSDWFWWYGDDFYSEMSDKFDSLFRAHIANVYSYLNDDVPFEVLQPIKKTTLTGDIKQPSNKIYPTIDGNITDYFEWQYAGVCYLNNKSSTMYLGKSYLTKLFFGFDEEHLYLRIDALKPSKEIFQNCKLEINLENKDFFKIEYDFNSCKTNAFKDKKEIFHNIKIKHNDIIEGAIPLIDFSITFGETLKLTIEIMKDNTLIERAPYDSALTIKVPENTQLEYWDV